MTRAELDRKRAEAEAWNRRWQTKPVIGQTTPTFIQKNGPGTELKRLLDSLALSLQGCACEEKRAEMDTWGPDACERNAPQIEAWLRDQARKVGWVDKLKAGVLLAGYVARGEVSTVINPLDPAPGLLAEAVRRARAAVKVEE